MSPTSSFDRSLSTMSLMRAGSIIVVFVLGVVLGLLTSIFLPKFQRVKRGMHEAPATLTARGRAMLSEFHVSSKSASDMNEVWQALAVVYSQTDEEDKFRRMLRYGTENHALPSEVVWAVEQWWDDDEQVGIMNDLASRSPYLEESGDDLAKFYLEQEAHKRSAEIARARLKRDREPQESMMRILIDSDLDQAKELIPHLAETQGAWSESTYGSVADLFCSEKSNDEALRVLKAGLRFFPHGDSILFSLARCDVNEAKASCLRRIEAHNKDHFAWQALGRCERDLKDSSGAMKAFVHSARCHLSESVMADLIELDCAKALPVLEELVRESVDDEHIGTLGDAYVRCDRFDDAAKAYLRALTRDPLDPEWLDKLRYLQPETVQKFLAPRIADAPGTAESNAVGTYAQALCAMGKHRAAYVYFVAAFESSGHSEDSILELAMHDSIRAKDLIRGATEGGESGALGKVSLALVESADGLRTRARVKAVNVLRDDPDDARIVQAAFRVWPERAMHIIQAETKTSCSVVWWLGLARIERDRENAEASIRAYDEAIRMVPSNAYWRIERYLMIKLRDKEKDR